MSADHVTMRESLLETLQREWLTPVSALQKCQCFSLSQRCGDLRREGWSVHDKWVDLPNGKRVKAYFISGQQQVTEAA